MASPNIYRPTDHNDPALLRCELGPVHVSLGADGDLSVYTPGDDKGDGLQVDIDVDRAGWQKLRALVESGVVEQMFARAAA